MGSTMSNMQNPNITGPQQNRAQWGDLDTSEKGARVLSGAGQGLAQGFQNYQNQNAAMRQGGGGGAMPQFAQAPIVDPSYFAPMQQPQKRGPNNLAFYGGS
jgi:hypothetical protein